MGLFAGFNLVIGEVKHHLYVKRQTRICTTWSTFLLTCRLRFIISTHNLVVSRNFLSIRIVLSFFYLPIFYSEKFLTWIWRLPFAVYVKLKLSINPLSPNIHMQILQTDLHTFPSRISWENLIKDQGIFPLGDHFINSRNLISWHCMDIVRRKLTLNTIGTWRVKRFSRKLCHSLFPKTVPCATSK